MQEGEFASHLKPGHPRPGWNFLDQFTVRGYVDWELVDEDSGKVVKRGEGYTGAWWEELTPEWLHRFLRHLGLKLGTENAVVNHARNKLANSLIGTAITVPTFVAVGTGTNAVSASDTALQTVSQYDGSNDAKAVSSRTLKGSYTSRMVAQFLTTEANITIRELGLFEANDASQNMWARVAVNITKASSQRLNVYWYVLFERRASLAIKTGASIGATGTIVADTDSTLTFASAVTIAMIENNSTSKMYFMLNGAVVGGATPTGYDFVLEGGQGFYMSEEEIEVTTLHVMSPVGFSMPNNQLTVRGW